MKRLTPAELEAATSTVEAVLDATGEIDPWCSGLDWVMSVNRGFAPEAELLLLESSRGSQPGYALLSRYQLEDGRSMIAGLEPLWGFASPIFGAEIEELASEIADELATDPAWDVLVLPGVPKPTGPTSFAAGLVRGLGRVGEIGAGEGITRQVANLEAGYDAWLQRRSPRFRRTLRRAGIRGLEAGVEFVDVGDEEGVFDRLLAIEERSWKGQEGSGITSPEMATTYRTMVERLGPSGRLRAHVARLGGRDVGYILGGIRARRYRGLQLAYATDAAELSIGHLLQNHQIHRLCLGGEADAYDLGMDLDYKRRWADEAVTTFTLVVQRSAKESSQRLGH